MRALTLAYYDLKRLIRHRAVPAALIAVPLLVALLRSAFPDSSALRGGVWACPLICALLVCASLAMQRSTDSVSGLTDALRSTPLSNSSLLASRLIAGAFIFAAQMVVFLTILALRF